MFGIDPASIFNKIQSAQQSQQAQPNQFSDGNLQSVDNTSWMAPSFQNQIQAPSQPNGNTGFAGNATEVAQSREQNQQQQQPMLQPGNGTAIDAVNSGWMMPSSFNNGYNPYLGDRSQVNSNNQQNFLPPMPPGLSGSGNNVSNPNQQGPTYGNYTPHAGWDTGKLQDPNKHDPKYDWLRAVQSVGGNKDLNSVVDYYNKNFGSNGQAKYSGGDLVDFGGGVGPVDVLFDQEGKREDLWAPQWSNSSFSGSGSGNSGVQNAQQNAAAPSQNVLQALLSRFQSMQNRGINPVARARQLRLQNNPTQNNI